MLMIELNDQRTWILGELDTLCTDCYVCSHRNMVRDRIEAFWKGNVTKEIYAGFLSANSWIWGYPRTCLRGGWAGGDCVAGYDETVRFLDGEGRRFGCPNQNNFL
jgi:hypothetical protein